MHSRWMPTAPRLLSPLRSAAVELADLVFPPICTLCEARLEDQDRARLCGRCRRGIESAAGLNPCPRCARSRGAMETGEDCLGCRSRRTPLASVVALGEYRGALRTVVLAGKRRAYQPLLRSMGIHLGSRVQQRWGEGACDCVTAVPSHWLRRLRRGACPAEILARQVASELGRPFRPLLRCTRRTAKQGTLGDRQRKRNVRGAFAIKRGYAFADQTLLVVDDVMTTGSTLQAVARVLRSARAAEVRGAVVARGTGDHRG